MIEFSERESDLFHLRFGRATIQPDFHQWSEMQKACADMDLDYLRLKIVNPGSDFLAGFDAMRSQADLMGIIRLYKIIMSPELCLYTTPVAEFRKVTPDDRLLLKELLIE